MSWADQVGSVSSGDEDPRYDKCDAIIQLATEVEPLSPPGVLLGIAIGLLQEGGASLEEVLDTARVLFTDGESLGKVLAESGRCPVS